MSNPPLLQFSCLPSISFREAQDNGIWAWDCHFNEAVLVIPMVLAMLGDNPMQSEFACHIRLHKKFFCRTCWVKGRDAEDETALVPLRSLVSTLGSRTITSDSNVVPLDGLSVNSDTQGSISELSLEGRPDTAKEMELGSTDPLPNTKRVRGSDQSSYQLGGRVGGVIRAMSETIRDHFG